MFKNLSFRTALAGLLMFGLSLSALATTPPSMGLGQAWPSTTDVSASPDFHAYVFMLGGVEYVQVNDINGNVLGAIGTANGQFITLPIGRFSQYVATPQEPAALASVGTPINSPATVYQDASILITATPLSNGALGLNASSTCDPVECSSRIASSTATTTTCDPIECSSRAPLSTATTTMTTTTCDPIECSGRVQ